MVYSFSFFLNLFIFSLLIKNALEFFTGNVLIIGLLEKIPRFHRYEFGVNQTSIISFIFYKPQCFVYSAVLILTLAKMQFGLLTNFRLKTWPQLSITWWSLTTRNGILSLLLSIYLQVIKNGLKYSQKTKNEIKRINLVSILVTQPFIYFFYNNSYQDDKVKLVSDLKKWPTACWVINYLNASKTKLICIN